MSLEFVEAAPAAVQKRSLSAADAVDIWLARWLGVRPKAIIARYGCDPRRLYEIWDGTRYPQSRANALALMQERYPRLVSQTDTSPHRRIPLRPQSPDQLSLFD